jgi:hypothetical protein
MDFSNHLEWLKKRRAMEESKKEEGDSEMKERLI